MREHYNLPILEKCEIGHYLNSKADIQLETHSHSDSIEICYLNKGRQVYRVNGQTIHMKGGDYFITLPNVPHDSAGELQDRGELFWFILEIPKRNRPFLQLPKAEGTVLREKILNITSPYFRGNQESAQLWKRLVTESQKETWSPLDSMEFRMHLVACLCNMLRCSQENTLELFDEVMDQCSKKICADPYQTPSLERLAHEANISLSRFKARFRRSIGLPPGEFINRNKIELAKEKLLEYDNLTDLAYALGFSSSQYFSTVFKRYTRMTPSEWIQKNIQP